MSKATFTDYGFRVEMPKAIVSFGNECSFRLGEKRETHVVTIDVDSQCKRFTRKIDVYISRAGSLRFFDRTDPQNIKEMALVDPGFDADHVFNHLTLPKQPRAKQ